MYYFVKVFKVDSTNVEYSLGKVVYRKTIYQNTIECDSKEDAKKHIFNLYGKIPLRKINNMEDNDLYGYIAKSTRYWFDYYHKEYIITCSNCHKTIKVKGNHELSKHSNKYGQYCCEECMQNYTRQMIDIERKNDPWINENDHLGVPKDSDKHFAGYIYRITNKRNHKSYIGKTIKPPLFRWWQHLKSDSQKFERLNITDLLFEVIEIVTYDENLESDQFYKDAEDKLARREMFYITRNNTTDPDIGFNKMIEKRKVGNDYCLQLSLEFD